MDNLSENRSVRAVESDSDMQVFLITSWKRNEPPRNGSDLRLLCLEQACMSSDRIDTQVVDHFPYAANGGRASELAARWGWLFFPNSRFAAKVAAAQRDSDVVVLHRLGAAWASAPSDLAKCIVDVDDIPSQICEQGLCRGPRILAPLKWLRFCWVRQAEKQSLKRFGAVLVCSEDDARYLGLDNVHVVHNAFPREAIVSDDSTAIEPSDLLFVGELAYKPNEQGLRWFIEHVFPKIRRKRPGTTLRVVGRVPAKIPDAWDWRFADGVEFVGSVPSIPPYLDSTTLSICPLLEGRGTRIKILESLALKRCVVSTTIGAYGLALGKDSGVCRADAIEDFAECCDRLLSDPETRIRAAEQGQRIVRELYSPESAMRSFLSVVKTVGRNREALQ
ncbi:hypothetical protein EC9_25250 [Rosistilla ulvae]|uniref:Glycosyl transferases group 1 n=1 Tax=Rosistilla ulvae TaxID=1930277 RepID=A0A517M0D0_9BACT|nr:glycosyltransferase [Rosistilla ulvae]QDS88335.1 hypothetical protein EC9_25250 [Rosistilla ulvae]